MFYIIVMIIWTNSKMHLIASVYSNMWNIAYFLIIENVKVLFIESANRLNERLQTVNQPAGGSGIRLSPY